MENREKRALPSDVVSRPVIRLSRGLDEMRPGSPDYDFHVMILEAWLRHQEHKTPPGEGWGWWFVRRESNSYPIVVVVTVARTPIFGRCREVSLYDDLVNDHSRSSSNPINSA